MKMNDYHRVVVALAWLLALSVAPVQAAGVLVQSRVSSSSGASPHTLAFSSPTTSGNLLVVLTSTVASVTAVTDTLSDAFARCGAEGVFGSSHANIWIADASAGTPTVSVTDGGTNGTLVIAEYSGLAPSASACDQTASNGAFSTGPNSSATPTTTQASETAVCNVALENTANVTAMAGGFTLRAFFSAINGIGWGDATLSTTGAQTCTGTIDTARNWVAQVATLKAAAVSGCGASRSRTLMGVGC